MFGPVTLSIHAEAVSRARGFARRRLAVVDLADAGISDVDIDALTFDDYDNARTRMIGNLAAFAGRPAQDPQRRRYADVIGYLSRCMADTDTTAATPAVQGALF